MSLYFPFDLLLRMFCCVGRPSPMPKESMPNNNGQSSTFQDDELGSLPEGWEERVHTDGRIFYIDHSNDNVFHLPFPFYSFLIRSLVCFQTLEPHSGKIQDCQIQKSPVL